MSVNYLSFIISPPLIGVLATNTSRQSALFVIIVVGLMMIIFTRRLAYVTQKFHTA